MTRPRSAPPEALARFLDETISTRDPIIVRSRGREDVALIAASELNGLIETAYLLRSNRNAARLSSALEKALNGEGEIQTPDALAA